MKKSNSKSKYIHGQCVRVTIPLKLESNQTSEDESDATLSQLFSDDRSEDSSESESDAGSLQSPHEADSEASENVSDTSSDTSEEFRVPQCASTQTYLPNQNAKSVATQTVSDNGSEDSCCICCFWA